MCWLMVIILRDIIYINIREMVEYTLLLPQEKHSEPVCMYIVFHRDQKLTHNPVSMPKIERKCLCSRFQV